ncbi:MAG: cbb3-type cytochrome oxidase subunit 3 [Povalibacter sp.]
MTMGLFRGLLTAVLFIAFTALWVWAWSKRREPEFREAALLPLADEQMPGEQA